MTSAITEKARNLTALSRILPVPPFVVLRPGEEPTASLLASVSLFMIRGCIAGEDLPGQSMAGQGMTLGPIKASEAVYAINRLFQESNALECICQVYIDAPSGVLICTSEAQALLEYTRESGAVTGGRTSPFAAVFPNNISRYSALSRCLPLLFREFGTCDVELLNPVDPMFVQVRPYTHTLSFDEEMVRAKMLLQELEGDRWIQNEFCSDLLESPRVELTLIRLYCDELVKITEKIGISIEQLHPDDFKKVGRQIFMRDMDITPHFSNSQQIIRTGQWLFYEYSRLALSLQQEQMIASELMRAAIVFRTYYDLLERLPSWLSRRKRAKVLDLRQQCRQRLLEVAASEPLPTYAELSRRLKPIIEKDSVAMTWISMEYAAETGVVIIPGHFEQGPWQAYTPGTPSPVQPCYLVSDELYPELYALFPCIKGIICSGGGINSHLALLAREWGMPLWIQVPDAQRFLQMT